MLWNAVPFVARWEPQEEERNGSPFICPTSFQNGLMILSAARSPGYSSPVCCPEGLTVAISACGFEEKPRQGFNNAHTGWVGCLCPLLHHIVRSVCAISVWSSPASQRRGELKNSPATKTTTWEKAHPNKKAVSFCLPRPYIKGTMGTGKDPHV